MRPTKDEYFMRLAQAASTRSTCLRRSVGCVLVDARGHELAIAYNGAASGEPHCNEEQWAYCGKDGVGPMAYLMDTMPNVQPETAKQAKGGEILAPFAGHHTAQPREWIVKLYPHACEAAFKTGPSGSMLDACGAIHAEQNALVKCRDPWVIDTAYVTTAPCMPCTKLLLGTSCKRVVFLEQSPHSAAAQERWIRAGRIWEALPGIRVRG